MIEFMLDTANIEAIEHFVDTFPISGVTTNPTILKAEGKLDFFPHMQKIRNIIGIKRSFHIQIFSETAPEMIREAETILRKIDDQVYIKIPCTEEGFKAMACLQSRGIHITATAIYTQMQGLMAAACEADYIALYYNRMKNMDIDADHSIRMFRHILDQNNMKSKILAASFHNIRQTTDALDSGAHSITVAPAVLHDAYVLPFIKNAVDGFRGDWIDIHGDVSIADM